MASSDPAHFSIARAAASDLAELHRMVLELAEFEHLAHLCVSTPDDLGRALFGPRPVAEALIGRLQEDSQVVAGFALFFHTYSTFLGRPSLWLEDVFVRPSHRGRGLGRRFLAELAAIARDGGCGRFEWAVLDWNRAAIGFYESLGAAVLPDWRIARVTGTRLADLARGRDMD
ncbi:MAG: GNAT family N-acetyltransferase [Proteobacteria bacterium]|jgi:GNAT superfamily N-acetyltransferase|nr:GNAT family N-acetyltransferase [Pseudomonadota bacterium]